MDKIGSSSAILQKYPLQNIRYDLVSSIIVALVAIPLCLGIALASGVPLFSGIIAGIIGGIVVGILSQSQVSVSGPAAGLAAIVVATISQLGSFEAFLFALMIAGLIQISIGLLKAGFIADYVPSNVVQGLLAAVGIMIILKQLPFAFGYVSHADFLALLKSSQVEILEFRPLLYLSQHISWGATFITLVSLLLLIYWPRVRLLKLNTIPAPIVVVLLSVLINFIYSYVWPEVYLSSPEYLVNIPVVNSLKEISTLFVLPDFSQWQNMSIYTAALTIAAVASLETLLNLEAAEKIDKKKRYCSRNKEMFAQGLGNMASGLIGGLPITSVVVRSSVNIESGSRSKLSTIFHGIILLIVALILPKWMNYIPLSSLAAILIYTGYKLASIKTFKYMKSLGYVHFFPFMVTTLAIIFTNLLQGILIGLTTAIFFILYNSSKKFFAIVTEKYPHCTILRLLIPEEITFLNKAAFIAELNMLPSGSHVIVDGSNNTYMDHDIVELIKDFAISRAPRKKISLNITGFENQELPNQNNFSIATTQAIQANLTPKAVLELLKEGNKRFVFNRPIHRNFRHLIKETSTAQHPIAVFLGCIDSRVPVEIIFDQGIGDIFCVRVAGNIADIDVLGSIEYACSVAGAKLIVVMGHQECGAIKAACDDVELGNITALLAKIKPAIQEEKVTKENRNSQSPSFVENVTRLNIVNIQQYIYKNSSVLREMISRNDIAMIGGIYDVKSGKVDFSL